ncbi:MAG: ABC transporter substrate-binding protein [Chloroflexi bacterium]|nr:ABC transporter substrate-binding protein [Chloroflexota bacterium]
MSTSRTRMIFFVIVGLAAVIICAAIVYSVANQALTPEATATPSGSPTTAANTGQDNPTPAVNFTSPNPIFGPNYTADGNLPTYICGADAFGSYFTLQQMQMAGTDIANGFHLGIVPFFLDGDPAYDVSEELRTALLENGQWDCLLTTLDAVALNAPGVVTAVVDESAGADQLWVRGDINTINDLQGQRITFARGSVGEYFMYYALSIARLNPRFDVTLIPQDSVAEAVAYFNSGQADVVSGWEPDIYDAETSGGSPLLSSAQMRVIIDVVVTSRQSLASEAELVQNFHNAWFATLKAQVEGFDTAAQQIAAWGHNDWSFVYPETAAADFTAWLENVAQADLGDNTTIMRDTRPLITRMEIARRVWAASGLPVSDVDIEQLIDPSFVARSAQQAALSTTTTPINDSFSINAQLDLTDISPDSDAATLAVLPCRRFTFLPESTELTLESRRILDDCVVPTMLQSVGLLLKVEGSSAWPGPAGTFTEQEIAEFAEARAQSVVDYLVTQGIDPARFIVTSVLPPPENRETEDPEIQALDRFVEMSLITSGR